MEGQRPRVFQLITRLGKGGASENLISTVEGLDEYDFTVGFGATFDRAQVRRLHEMGVETQRFPLIRHYNPFTQLPAVIHLAWYLRRNDFDIVHTNSTEAGIVGRFAAALAGVPFVIHTILGVPFTEDRNDTLNRFVEGCERLATKRTDCIVAIADVIKEEYLDRGIGTPSQYRTVRLGIELETFQDATPANDLPGERPRTVMVGRLVDGKGHGLLLDAIEATSERRGSVCIVGDGPLKESLTEEIADRGLDDEVYMTGFRRDIPNVLAASDLLVLPSFREGTPRVIIEAMASGLPVIGTEIAGIPEQVEDGESGYLIPTGDPAALSEKLTELRDDPHLRERMGRRGRELAVKFSRETMLEDLSEVYRTLLSSAHE